MTRLKGMDILMRMNDVDDGLVLESMELLSSVLLQAPAKKTRRGLFGLVGTSAWAAAVGLVVAVGLAVSVIFAGPGLAGMLSALLHPEETTMEEPEETEPEETEPEVELVPIPEDAIHYREMPDVGKAYVTGLDVTDGNYLVIPNVSPSGLPVQAIDSDAFAHHTELVRVTLPESVRTIYQRAFAGCSSLVTVDLPEGVETIGSHAFSQCASLREIELPANLAHLEPYAFRKCSSLTSVTISSTVNQSMKGFAYLLEGTFYDCVSLETVILPDNLDRIKDKCFAGCLSLQRLELPDQINVDDYAFANCTALTEVIVNGSLSTGSAAFWRCSSLRHVAGAGFSLLHSSHAFSGCFALTELTVTDTLEQWALNEEEEITEKFPYVSIVHCADGDVTYHGQTGVPSLKFASQGDGTCAVTGIGTYPDSDVVIPAVSDEGDTVVEIRGFSEMAMVRSLTIPTSVTTIKSLNQCYELTRIVYEGTVAEWNAISFGKDWLSPISHITVYCTDGEISLEG